MSNVLKFMGAAGTAIPIGQQEYTTPGTYSWTCPDGVTSVSVVYIVVEAMTRATVVAAAHWATAITSP